MDGEMEDHDVLYDSLPEMCNISSALNQDTIVTSAINEENSSSSHLNLETPKNETSKEKSKINPVKRCSCRDNVQWVWEDNNQSSFVRLMNDNMDVKFHKRESNGTGVVRCTEPMANNQYYWEVKMTHRVYGSDIMVGIGTSEAQTKDLYQFVSKLGMDSKTWGFSYKGLFHHNGNSWWYSTSFGQGSTIGVHLDLWRGTLSFYKDRKNLGVASTGLKGKTLYAMACSTAAQSGMRIVHSCSFPSSLQFLCCEKLRQIIPDDKNVLDVIDIPSNLKIFLRSKLNWLLSARHLETDSHVCSYSDNASDDDDDESVNNDPYSITGQYILLGSVLLSNLNRFQTALRTLSQEERENPPESLAKRPRFSHPVHSDCDSE